MCLFQRAIMPFVASELINFSLLPSFFPTFFLQLFFSIASVLVLSIQPFSPLYELCNIACFCVVYKTLFMKITFKIAVI